MYLVQLVLVALSALIVAAKPPTRTIPARRQADLTGTSPFVSTNPAGDFVVNGSRLNFIGTNAYWLPTLNTADDIDFTLGNMSAAGIKVVRVWAFNDVETIPVNGTWFQLIANGTTTINNGTNGLQKLDTVIQLAEKHNIFVLLSLTNNWNPRPLLDNITTSLASGIQGRDMTPGTNNSLPRNTLSNDYGGMDVYVREFANDTKNHDDFYLNSVVQTHFNNYVSTIVSRYVNNTSVFSWEIANDPRCNSSLPTSANCTTETVTQFHANVTANIKKIDPNHLVSSGAQGFFCADCPKLFFKPPSAPQTSATPGLKRRAKAITKKQLLAERRVIEKKVRKLKQSQLKQNSTSGSGGLRIRGRWMPTETRRQSTVPEAQGVGSAFDGSQGVDSEDILAVPGLGFGTFQLFPDQNDYGFNDPTVPAFNNTVEIGLNWIKRHALLGQLLGKPMTLTGFGLVTQANAPVFVPFNSTVAPFAPDNASDQVTQPFGVTDQQRNDAYTQWLNAGIAAGLQGMIQYQWSQGNLTTAEGTVIQPTVTGTGVDPVVTGTGLTPNDGYAIQGVGDTQQQAVGVLQQAAQAIAPDT